MIGILIDKVRNHITNSPVYKTFEFIIDRKQLWFVMCHSEKELKRDNILYYEKNNMISKIKKYVCHNLKKAEKNFEHYMHTLHHNLIMMKIMNHFDMNNVRDTLFDNYANSIKLEINALDFLHKIDEQIFINGIDNLFNTSPFYKDKIDMKKIIINKDIKKFIKFISGDNNMFLFGEEGNYDIIFTEEDDVASTENNDVNNFGGNYLNLRSYCSKNINNHLDKNFSKYVKKLAPIIIESLIIHDCNGRRIYSEDIIKNIINGYLDNNLEDNSDKSINLLKSLCPHRDYYNIINYNTDSYFLVGDRYNVTIQ